LNGCSAGRSSSLRYAAELILLAPIEDVWGFVAEPYHLSDWWPGIAGVEPDRRGLAAGARWKVQGPSYFKKSETPAVLVVHEVVPIRRFAFELLRDRLGAELELTPEGVGRTRAVLTIEGRFLWGPRRTLGKQALRRLYDLIQTAAAL
jgi:uncharacterized protein YndB with AHSA1/START domain